MPDSHANPKYQAILQAATTMFLNHGYRNVSMDKVAQAAPVSKATLYNYFNSKNDLFAAVIDECSHALLHTMNQTLSQDDDLPTALTKIAQSFLDLLYSAEGLGIYKLVIAESHDFPELGQIVYDNVAKPALTQLEIYLTALKNNGFIDIENPRFSADAFFSLLQTERHFRCLLAIDTPPSEQEKKSIIHSVVTFYLRGILDVV